MYIPRLDSFILQYVAIRINLRGDYMDYKRLGERIREERLRLNLTQAQLAEDIDISDTYMGAIERGERKPTLETLYRISNALSVSMSSIVAEIEKELLSLNK